jgi:hypothetical protein
MSLLMFSFTVALCLAGQISNDKSKSTPGLSSKGSVVSLLVKFNTVVRELIGATALGGLLRIPTPQGHL